MKVIFNLLFFTLFTIFVNQVDSKYHAVLKTCSGWSLGRLPEVKDFIFHELHNYPIDVIYCGGDPYISIVDDNGKIIFETPIRGYTKTSIMNYLEENGFKRLQE